MSIPIFPFILLSLQLNIWNSVGNGKQSKTIKQRSKAIRCIFSNTILAKKKVGRQILEGESRNKKTSYNFFLTRIYVIDRKSHTGISGYKGKVWI